MSVATDIIEREILLNAPRSKVWTAISNAEEFGKWFGMSLEGQTFVPGKSNRAQITACGHENLVFEIVVDRIEPEKLFSYRWHPCPIDLEYDYSKDPMTLVTFELSDAEGGTLLRVIESGFDAIPAARLAEAYRENSRGWDGQLKNIEKYLAS